MYTGSADFIAANSQAIQKHKISGTIDSVSFGPEDVLAGSVTIKNQCSDSSDLKIGCVYVGSLTATFLPSVGIEAKTWNGRKLTVNFSLLIDEENQTWETFQLGVFTVAEAKRTLQGMAITAYDNMAAFDKAASWDYLPSGSVYSILADICSKCSVTLGMTSAQCQALTNGTRNLGLFPGSDVATYRDILYWLAQAVGGFATIDRLGRLVLRSYGTIFADSSPAPSLPQDRRLQGAGISDYVTDFVGVTLYDMEEELTRYYGSDESGVVYNMGANPFIQYGSGANKRDMAMAVYYGISEHPLRPFTASIMSAPIWELGDRIKLTGGIATGYETVTVIHSISFSPGKGTQLACYGANPQITAQQTQQAASAGASAQKKNSTTYKRYANSSILTVSSTPVEVVNITFTAEENTDFDVWHEILLTSALASGSDAVQLTASYYLDNELLVRRPVETYEDEAQHILTLNYSEGVNEGVHTWKVYLEASGGTATIDTSGAIAVLKGQGLTRADGWDGIIVLDDTVYNSDVIIPVATVSDSGATVYLDDNETIDNLADTVNNAQEAIGTNTITEAINISLWAPAFAFATEDGLHVIADETGDYYIETEH